MFITPYFWGCKYTNNFLFINKNIVFQHFVLLITFLSTPARFPVKPGMTTGHSLSSRPSGASGDILLP